MSIENEPPTLKGAVLFWTICYILSLFSISFLAIFSLFLYLTLTYQLFREYELSVQAWDGQFSNSTTVKIDIININDMAPKFKEEKYTTTLKENFVPSYPIFK